MTLMSLEKNKKKKKKKKQFTIFEFHISGFPWSCEPWTLNHPDSIKSCLVNDLLCVTKHDQMLTSLQLTFLSGKQSSRNTHPFKSCQENMCMPGDICNRKHNVLWDNSMKWYYVILSEYIFNDLFFFSPTISLIHYCLDHQRENTFVQIKVQLQKHFNV